MAKRDSVRAEAVWRALQGDRLEHVVVRSMYSTLVFDGTIVGVAEARPLRLEYQVICDRVGRAQRVWLGRRTDGEIPDTTVAATANRRGVWRVSGPLFPPRVGEWEGCLDIHLAFSAVSYALPVRRAQLGVGESAGAQVAVLDEDGRRRPSVRLDYRREDQRTYLATGDGTATRFTVDDLGLPNDVEGRWQRLA